MSKDLTTGADRLEVKTQSKRTVPRIRSIAVAITVLYFIVGYVATIPVVGNHAYWRTLRAQPSDFGLRAETISFPSTDDHVPLTAWYIGASGPPLGSVIIAHGIDGNRSDMLPRAAFLVRDGYNALVLDLRDHGQSGGDYASPGYVEARDVLGAVEYLKSRGAQPPFIALGHSYGAVAVLWAAARSPAIAAVIADSAYISFEDMVHRATFLLADDPSRSHLLLAYLVDHVAIHLAFVICSIVSIFLVVSYLRLVVGIRFAAVEASVAQLVYLVLFSYAFFFKGFTGLAITVGSIVTLFVVMQATGRIRWQERFAKAALWRSSTDPQSSEFHA